MDYDVKVMKDPTERLPMTGELVLRLGRVGIAFELNGKEIADIQLSYFNIIGWGHSSKTLKLVELNPDKSKR